MHVVFVASIRGKDKHVDAYAAVVERLLHKKFNVYYEHVMKNSQDDLDAMSKSENERFHKDLIQEIKRCDVVVGECSHQSVSVGYLISFAVQLGKPTVMFYHASSGKPNLFPTLLGSGKLFLVKYHTLEELKTLVDEYVEYARENLDVRFNFFIPPSLEHYLGWITKNNKVPRSAFLRGLIERHMARNEEYQKEFMKQGA